MKKRKRASPQPRRRHSTEPAPPTVSGPNVNYGPIINNTYGQVAEDDDQDWRRAGGGAPSTRRPGAGNEDPGTAGPSPGSVDVALGKPGPGDAAGTTAPRGAGGQGPDKPRSLGSAGGGAGGPGGSSINQPPER